MITRTFKLCLNAGTGSAPYINVSQYDEGETWLFELYSETGERYIPSTGAIVGVKSDGHGIINTGTVDNEGRVVITETQQMTASAGRAIFELSIDGLTHGTANFIVAVERKPTDDAVMSDSDLSLIQEAVDAAEVIEDLIEGHDPDEVIADAVDAWLDAHPEATTTVQDGAITEAKLNDEVTHGVFEDMTVGTALSVWNDEGVTDSLAYKFRQTGADAVRELDEIVGGTIAWNQLVNTGATSVTVQSGHKYLSKVNSVQTIGASTGSAISINDASADNVFDLTAMFGSTVADAIYAMEQSSAGSGVAYFRSLFPNAYYAYNAGELVSVEGLSAHVTNSANLFDEATAVKYNKFISNQDKWYAISDGSMCVCYYCRPNTTYTVSYGDANVSVFRTGVINTDPATAGNQYPFTQVNITVSAHAFTTEADAVAIVIQINRGIYEAGTSKLQVQIGDTATAFKKYAQHTYPLDSTLTLRGVPKWNNGLYFDGDIYRHDGSVSRRYGTRAYQSGDESLTDAITDGTNTVYKLTTPTAETADPYQQYQICDGKGTAEYVSTTVTPVGHNTFYPVDIVSKVNKLPSDFSTLIAPTEQGFKATRNYTAKQFLIINNQLYRVTANIANGANIVPNTNVQAVTIADILTTLI